MKKLTKPMLAGLFAMGLSISLAAQNLDTSGNTSTRSSVDQASEVRPALMEMDKLLIDAKRQLELMSTIGAITRELELIRPFGDTILVLLDESKPMPERWRRVLASPGDIATQGPSVPDSSQIQELEHELLVLQDRVEIMNAEMAVMAGAPNMAFTPMPELTVSEEDPEADLIEQLENWKLDARAVRYAQAGQVGVQPAVWLDSPTGGARMTVGSSVQVGERSIRLDRLERQRDGRVRLSFSLNGNLVQFDW